MGRFNAKDVRAWMKELRRDGCCGKLNRESRELLLQLFETVSVLKAVGDDDVRVFWIEAPKGEGEEGAAYFQLLTKHSVSVFSSRSYRVELDGVHVLDLSDRRNRAEESVKEDNEDAEQNAEDRGVDAVPFICFLIEAAGKVIAKVRQGTYAEEMDRNLPREQKYGLISRKDYWDILPEERRKFRGNLREDEIAEFMRLQDEASNVTGVQEITAGWYFSACEAGYRRAGLADSCEGEEGREAALSAKELYEAIADGRDGGLTRLNESDPEAMAQWLKRRSYAGAHPFEIVSSALSGICLYINADQDRGYTLNLTGSVFWSLTTLARLFLGMRRAGFPVLLSGAEAICRKLREEDVLDVQYLEAKVQYRFPFHNGMESVAIRDEVRQRVIVEKTVWSCGPEVVLA